MIDWQPMSSAPLDGTPVLVLFRCSLTTKLETSPAWHDDGKDCDGVPVERPSWWAFSHQDTEEVKPLAWSVYPVPDEASWAKLGIAQVAA